MREGIFRSTFVNEASVPLAWRSLSFVHQDDSTPVTTLLGGLGGKPRTWNKLAQMLSQTGSVLAPALPKHYGDGDFQTLSEKDLWGFVDWILNETWALGAKSNFVGASMGGMLSLAMSFMNPSTDTVVAISPIFHMKGLVDYYCNPARALLKRFPNLDHLPGLGETPARNSRGMTAAGDIGAWVEEMLKLGVKTHARRIVLIEAPEGGDRCARVGANDRAIEKLLAQKTRFDGNPLTVERHTRAELNFIIHGINESSPEVRTKKWESLQGFIGELLQ